MLWKLRDLEASLLDSSEGSEESLAERSLLDRTVRPGTPLQRRLQRGNQPTGSQPGLGDQLEGEDRSEEEGQQQLNTMADRDISGEDDAATLREEVLKARRERQQQSFISGPSTISRRCRQLRDLVEEVAILEERDQLDSQSAGSGHNIQDQE